MELMLHVPKKNNLNLKKSWQPNATIETLQKRAALLALLRQFFATREIYEVETPLLNEATVTDPFIESIPAYFKVRGHDYTKMFLQTSPEYAMKRLLAAGSGSIYQITKAFRQGDVSPLHNPEFSMLEWYRLGFDHHQLMDEVNELLKLILKVNDAAKISYKVLYEEKLNIDPHTISLAELKELAIVKNLPIDEESKKSITHKNGWLELFFSHFIEKEIGFSAPIFIYDFPIFNAALAKIRQDESLPCASRFEVYYKGIELANGFHELQDSFEQQNRFSNDLAFREQNHFEKVPIDTAFIEALQAGLPNCSGVALGLDRLFMLALGFSSLQEVMSFSF